MEGPWPRGTRPQSTVARRCESDSQCESDCIWNFIIKGDEWKETPGVEKAPGVSSPQRKESGRSGRDDGELRFGYDPAIHARRLRVYHRPRRLRMASRISIFFAARRFELLNSMG